MQRSTLFGGRTAVGGVARSIIVSGATRQLTWSSSQAQVHSCTCIVFVRMGAYVCVDPSIHPLNQRWLPLPYVLRPVPYLPSIHLSLHRLRRRSRVNLRKQAPIIVERSYFVGSSIVLLVSDARVRTISTVVAACCSCFSFFVGYRFAVSVVLPEPTLRDARRFTCCSPH